MGFSMNCIDKFLWDWSFLYSLVRRVSNLTNFFYSTGIIITRFFEFFNRNRVFYLFLEGFGIFSSRYFCKLLLIYFKIRILFGFYYI